MLVYLYNAVVIPVRFLIITPVFLLMLGFEFPAEALRTTYIWLRETMPHRKRTRGELRALRAYLRDERRKRDAAMAAFDKKYPPGKPLFIDEGGPIELYVDTTPKNEEPIPMRWAPNEASKAEDEVDEYHRWDVQGDGTEEKKP